MILKHITNRTDNFDIYMMEVGKAPNLTPELEKLLFTQVKNGSKSAEDEIFRRTAKFAIAIAKEYTDNGDKLMDLIQEANIGIITAIHKFDVELGYRFITFAVHFMRERISDFLDDSSLVRTTNNKLILPKVKKFQQEFIAKYNRKPTDDEILDALEEEGIKVNNLSYIKGAQISSIDEKPSEDSDEDFTEIGEFAEVSASHNSYMDQVDDEYTNSKLHILMSILNDTEKRMVSLYYGLGGNTPMNYETIAENETSHFGKPITKQRVQQIVTKAIEKMHNQSNNH